jgi:hypothetical protein
VHTVLVFIPRSDLPFAVELFFLESGDRKGDLYGTSDNFALTTVIRSPDFSVTTARPLIMMQQARDCMPPNRPAEDVRQPYGQVYAL